MEFYAKFWANLKTFINNQTDDHSNDAATNMEHPSMAAELGFVNKLQFFREAIFESEKKGFTVAKTSTH